MSLVQFSILAIDGLKCDGTRVINCDWIASGMKPVWVITEGCNDGDLVKIDYEDNGGIMGVAINDGNEFVVLNTTIVAIQDACCASGLSGSPTPQIDIKHRTICNETTNTWHYITIIYTDGVITSNTSLDSGIPCSDPIPSTPDIEQIRRCDVGTSTIWVDVVRYITDPIANITTNSILSSVDTLEECNRTDWKLLEVELIDDVAGDGTGLLTSYSELYAIEKDGTKTLISTLDIKGANYTLIGTRRNANEIGVLAKTSANQIILDGSTWTPTTNIVNFSYVVISVANVLTPPTYRGSNNVTVPLFAGESAEYNLIKDIDSFNNTNILITAQTGDKIKVSYTQITI